MVVERKKTIFYGGGEVKIEGMVDEDIEIQKKKVYRVRNLEDSLSFRSFIRSHKFCSASPKFPISAARVSAPRA